MKNISINVHYKVHIPSDHIVVFCVHFERDRRGFRARKERRKIRKKRRSKEKDKGRRLHRSHHRPNTIKSSPGSTVRDQSPQKAHLQSPVNSPSHTSFPANKLRIYSFKTRILPQNIPLSHRCYSRFVYELRDAANSSDQSHLPELV